MLTDTVSNYLSDKRMLLVLDNFEQVMDAAPLVTQLLTAAPGLKALISSREVLHIYGEQEFPVSPLSAPDTKNLPTMEILALFPAIELFVQRARAIKPEFTLTQTNASGVAQICARLGGLPLAIEMAAAQIKWLPLPRLQAQLSDRLAALVGSTRDLSPRQQTLRGAIDWSYNLLTVAERDLFARLAVFSGGFTLESAQAILGRSKLAPGGAMLIDTSQQLPITSLVPPRFASSIQLLADKSLLRNEVDATGESRFSMFEVIQEYAREKLAEGGDETAVRRRHAHYYLELSRRAEQELNGPQQEIWLNRLDADISNLRAALDFCLADDVTTGLQLASSLWQFWHVRGRLSEGRARIDNLLSRSDGRTPATVRAWAIRAIAALHQQLGDPAQATALAAESLELFRGIGDKSGIAALQLLLGNVAFMQSDYLLATTRYTEALQLYRETGNQSVTATLLTNLGLIAKDQGHYDRASALYAEALAVHRLLGNKRGIAIVLIHRSIVAYWLADYTLAAALAEAALALQRETGNRLDQAYGMENLGMVLFKQGELSRAADLLADSLAGFRELGDKPGIALLLTDQAALASAQGDRASATDLYRQALHFSVEVGARRRIAFCFEGLAMAMVSHQPDRAVRLFGAADQLRRLISAPLPPADQSACEASLAQGHELLGDAAFQQALAAGRSLTLEQAVAVALDD